MSRLQELGETLAGIDRDILQMSRELHQRAQSLSRAAQYAAAAVRQEEGPGSVGAAHAAVALGSAARAAGQAAVLLDQAAQQGRAYLARMVVVGGAAGGSAGGPTGGDPAGPVGPSGAARVQSVAEVASWLGDINPGYTGQDFDPRGVNCGRCAAAVFARLEGRGDAVAGLGTLSIPEMEAVTGRDQVKMTPGRIRELLIERGPGSHAVIGVDRSSGPGHWFNAYYDGERVVALDGQTGKVLDWPPDYGNVVHWDAGM